MAAVVESKSAEELALGMFRDEVRCTRIIRRMAEKAEACGDDLLAHERSTSANNSRLSVSRLARIIRAIRAEKEETDTNPQPRVK